MSIVIVGRLPSTKSSCLSSGILKTLIMAFAFHLCVSVAQGQEASLVKGFSLAMSPDEIKFVARTRFGLKVAHSDESLGLYRPGDDPDRTRPIAYFSYEDAGKVTCMHFGVPFFSGQTLLRDVLQTIQSAYGVKQFLQRKSKGYHVRYHGYTRFGEYVSVHSNRRKPSWVIFCSTTPR
jgi:hypothetical protein